MNTIQRKAKELAGMLYSVFMEDMPEEILLDWIEENGSIIQVDHNVIKMEISSHKKWFKQHGTRSVFEDCMRLTSQWLIRGYEHPWDKLRAMLFGDVE